jgi:hypothetical protein
MIYDFDETQGSEEVSLGTPASLVLGFVLLVLSPVIIPIWLIGWIILGAKTLLFK